MRLRAKPGEDLRDRFKRFRCTAETPWSPDMKGLRGVDHVDAREAAEQPDGKADILNSDRVRYECPHCGHSWETRR